MKNFVKYFLITITGIYFVVGCSDISDELDNGESKNVKQINITMIAKSSSNLVFNSAKIGAEAAAKNLSEKYSKINVNIDWSTPEKDDIDKQIANIKYAVKNKADAIIISCSDSDSLTKAINYAVKQGIPVMTFDSDAPDSKRFAFYGANDIKMGKKLMDELALLLNNRGRIAILGGSKTAPNLQNRVKGIKEAASKYSDIEIVGEFYHPESEEDAINEMLRVNKEYPDLKGWVMVGGWTMFGDRLMNELEPGKLKIVAVDALPVQLKYIENNFVQVLLGQPTFKWGEVSVESVIKKIHLDEEVKEITPLKTIKVNIENLGGWSRQLRAWGYKNIPDKYILM